LTIGSTHTRELRLLRPGTRDLCWVAAGAAVFLVIAVSAPALRRDPGAVHQLAVKASRIDLVTGMRASLAAASEAEKSALLAPSDEDSKMYADVSRAATAGVERKRAELATLLKDASTEERDLLEQFSKAFGEFRRIDDELLTLAVKNSNVKATRLAFGPAASAVDEIDAALSRIVAKSAAWPNAAAVARLALGAQSAVLLIDALLAPHIAEEADSKMDELEAAMAKQDETVRAGLGDLAKLPELQGDSDLVSASSAYARFAGVRAEILKLSRENTNVRSTAISLGEKPRVVTLCEGSLAALEQAILAEPPTGTDYGRFGRPVQIR
jgi:hypothetical protein